MLNKIQFAKVLVSALVVAVAIGPNPAGSAAALAVVLTHLIAERYFSRSADDSIKKDLSELKLDLVKLAEKQSKAELKGAFTARQNG